MSQYLAEVIDLHILIEALFARGEGSSAALMEHFDPSFTMVTTAGAAISLDQVSALFHSQAAKQPGLQIEVSNVDILAEWKTGAVVSYRETHTTAGNPSRSRFSTALFSLVNGKAVWRHLQETACT
ncbi:MULTISPECIES: nuclear transport factor 2 family protein [unclassified Pseudomonas]|uniref:nuclear transport factor 2 family protein n=1 Tax=unclassified Pseudomonas TaxID=196821 RepID=UPI000BDA5194|nr:MULTISPECIES: nuclear transport factor 2 family protein [unclassified Pseudomonas]PVZ12654.1 hypothetical protein F474_03459 [Pseudomonas sp. URIL14HWK12:I12]PVZ23195.1 hypothetical protein F470_02744 [Pseudomonas sp. URIL14HWK12:I10]PVZ32524.1 hypothetical protein F472_03091 [Pseudomonas sp. URIL14HWK12:I11]SNZ13596.1 hypothetical protein SAMN05660463_02440 [Pseudomonas sp. URIL14HWK12:I9]